MTPNQFRKRSGKLMKQAREAAGITIEQAAKHIGVSVNYMKGGLEDWNPRMDVWIYPSFADVTALARLYNVSVEYFVPLDKPLPEIKTPRMNREYLKVKPTENNLHAKSAPTLSQIWVESQQRIQQAQERNLNRRVKAVVKSVRKYTPKPYLD